MPICQKCGVELEQGVQICPLCDYPADEKTEGQIFHQAAGPNPGYTKLSSREKRRLFWELSAIFHFSALVMTLLIDLITGYSLDWSLYAITAIAASFVYITLIVFTFKKLWIFLPGLLVNTFGLLVLIDLFDNGINWFVSVGLPLAGFFIILLGLVMIFSFWTRQKGFNIIGLASLAIGVYCILVEVFIQMATGAAVDPTWSVIVAASLLPFALILFFLHYRLKRGTSLRKFFHL